MSVGSRRRPDVNILRLASDSLEWIRSRAPNRESVNSLHGSNWAGREVTRRLNPYWRSNIFRKVVVRLAKSGSDEMWLEIWKEKLDEAIAEFGIDSGKAQKARETVCDHLDAVGRISEARLLWEAQAESYRRSKGEDDRGTLVTECRLAVDLARTGEMARARDLLVHALNAMTVKPEPDREEIEWIRRQIAAIDTY
jgi:predicted house-cleaning noncanonical NTP pyrophosphatase (MazG superfamily)